MSRFDEVALLEQNTALALFIGSEDILPISAPPSASIGDENASLRSR
ncbi:hypothetical protein IVB38_15540 [Bradyrhizobium sp. 38]|nr:MULTISPECIES: hypothetical protein [unclassified Bradyrhizobium]MCK1337406.1 hypothetical protein [Bradyrhizobium sp. 38]MCK1780307.1 hypothetical protein [Bradyrhizobium sp. 132]